MTKQNASSKLWANAHKRVDAENGMGDPADALHKVPTIKALIGQIGKNPAALELLAGRRHEMTDAQITAALEAGLPPKAPKAAKVAPRVFPTLADRMSGISLYGKHGAPRS